MWKKIFLNCMEHILLSESSEMPHTLNALPELWKFSWKDASLISLVLAIIIPYFLAICTPTFPATHQPPSTSEVYVTHSSKTKRKRRNLVSLASVQHADIIRYKKVYHWSQIFNCRQLKVNISLENPYFLSIIFYQFVTCSLGCLSKSVLTT